jgi:hypothetical protein
MSKNLVPDDYYRAARSLLPEMDEDMRAAVEGLLKKAEGGEKVDNRLVEVITENKNLRSKFREALNSGGDKTMGMDFSQLAGNVTPPSAQKFICPVPGHNHINRIQKAGEDPGDCPVHKVALIPIDQKRGQ